MEGLKTALQSLTFSSHAAGAKTVKMWVFYSNAEDLK